MSLNFMVSLVLSEVWVVQRWGTASSLAFPQAETQSVRHGRRQPSQSLTMARVGIQRVCPAIL